MMERDFRNAVGKQPGEIARDIALFLELPCVIRRDKEIDLSHLLPNLNIRGQVAFALFSELLSGTDTPDEAEAHFRGLAEPAYGADAVTAVAEAFCNRDGTDYRAMAARYGANFTLDDEGFWPSCLALALDAGAEATASLMNYFRQFTFLLLEVAYREDCRPDTPYVWGYYESFHAVLENLCDAVLSSESKEDQTAQNGEETPSVSPSKHIETPLENPSESVEKPKITVSAVGCRCGSARENGYPITLGCDLCNTHPTIAAENLTVCFHLYNPGGKEAAVIRETVRRIEPGAVFHLGLTKQARGARIARVSVTATVGGASTGRTDAKIGTLESPSILQKDGRTVLSGSFLCDAEAAGGPVRFFAQLRNADGRIIGGGTVRISAVPGERIPIAFPIPLSMPDAVKLAWSAEAEGANS